MSIIAVTKVPVTWTIPNVIQALSKAINGKFEALNFEQNRNKPWKICYLRLSERLDPVYVVEKLNRAGPARGRLTAFIPRKIPDIALAARPRNIAKKTKMRKVSNVTKYVPNKPEQILIVTHAEIMIELQSKYTGLYNLSRKTNNKLLHEIAQTVFERLKTIMASNEESSQDCFKLSKCYRKLHPHFGDFQMILSNLHKIQDAEGTARGQVVESELASVSGHPYMIDNIPYDKVKEACNKYSERIIKKIREHVKGFDCEIKGTDKEGDIAQKRVREEFTKILPYLPSIIKQVITKHFVPQKSPFHRVRVYGEPFLPSKEQMTPLIKRHRVVKVLRSDRMYNLLKFNVPPDQYTSLMAMDGTVIGGAKLVIRSSDILLFKIPDTMRAEMNAVFGVDYIPEGQDFVEMEVDGDEAENWDMTV